MSLSTRLSALPPGQKIYFASDFHLGAPSREVSRVREQRLLHFLDTIRTDAHALLLVGDVFDFWFEYRHVVPKGFVRFLGKLAELVDGGLPVYIFTGNHDMWMADYFPQELGIPVYRTPQRLVIGGKALLVGHGDGLGPGDRQYKLLKRVFAHPAARRLFAALHPGIGMRIAHGWSRRSRKFSADTDAQFLGEDEWLLQYCRQVEAQQHHDYYIFGHRHLPLDLEVTPASRYINLGEWITHCTYAEFDGQCVRLRQFANEKVVV